MNKSKTLLMLLLTAVTLGASAQVKTFKAPALYGLKAPQAGTPTVLRDSIVSRMADGSLNFKTTYTYDEHGYLTSKLTRLGDGTYDDTDKSYFVDYEFDAQDRCTLRSVSRCQPNGQRGEETERTEARYGYNGYPYYEIRYEWYDGSRYAAEEIGYDEWMNPVYGIGREYVDDRLDVVYVARQQFTGRAYAQKEGDLELVLPHRLVSSVLYDKPFSGAENYVVEGQSREMVYAGDSVVTTYYKLEDAYDLTLDDDLTPYWTEDRLLVWQLNAAHTRPLTLRCQHAYYSDVVQGRRKAIQWKTYTDQCVDFAWDAKDRLSKLTWFSYDSFQVRCTIDFTYADDQANNVPLSKLLDVEDSDSWEDGGMDGYEGDIIYNWFGRLSTMKYKDEHYMEDGYLMTVDVWDEAGRMTHAVTTESEDDFESWLTYRKDGKIFELINEDDEPLGGYEKAVFNYDRWGIIASVEWYEATSLNGPWVKYSEGSHFVYSRRKRLWEQRTYEEGNWRVEEYVETDDNDISIILYGHKTKYWQGQPFRYTLDTYKDPRGPLGGYEEEDVEFFYVPPLIIYDWNGEQGEWMMTNFQGVEAYAHRTLDDGRIANEYYKWDMAAEDMVYVSSDYYTLDDPQRVVVRERAQGTDRFSYYGDEHWLQQAQWFNGQVDTYYYNQRNYVDPDMLSIDELRTPSATETWYSLQGQRLQSRPTQPGIYIHGGKKTVVR